jgi:hypothetical protein
MATNLDRYKDDLKKLISRGELLFVSLQHSVNPQDTATAYIAALGKDRWEKIKGELPEFAEGYQAWYSEAHAVVKQLLPHRLDDFIRNFEKPKSRKSISYENYVIEDALQGLQVTRGYYETKVVSADAAIPRMQQQLNIVKAVQARFESSLFDIRQLVQADLFDSELHAAEELNNKGFVRGAGAIAGVVLEKHLVQVSQNHSLKVTKKNPGISDLNDLLKANNVIETPVWRSIQHLGDLRNICDHDKRKEPKQEQVEELITGVAKITKTLF